MNETDLHYQVIKYIKKYHENALITPSLEKHQTRIKRRPDAYKKGYTGSQPDIIIGNLHKKYRGLCIELKTPAGDGILGEKQNNSPKQYNVN